MSDELLGGVLAFLAVVVPLVWRHLRKTAWARQHAEITALVDVAVDHTYRSYVRPLKDDGRTLAPDEADEAMQRAITRTLIAMDQRGRTALDRHGGDDTLRELAEAAIDARKAAARGTD